MSLKTTVIFLLLLAFFTVIFFWALINVNLLKSLIAQHQTLSGEADSNTTITLPIKRDHPAITSVLINYTFSGTIQQIKNTAEGLEITTDTGPIPFIVCLICSQPTQIYTVENGKQQEKKVSDLTTNSDVKVNASYDIALKKWKTNRITIIPSQQ